LRWCGTFPEGTHVTIEAVPDQGWTFSRWSGDLSGSDNPETINMSRVRDVSALFLPVEHELCVSGEGEVRVNGMLRPLPWCGTFSEGAHVNLEALCVNGRDFAHWGGDLNGDANPVRVVMDRNKTITMHCESEEEYELCVDGEGGVLVDGTLRSMPWCGVFSEGAEVTLEAIPNPGWHFHHWGGDLSGDRTPETIVMAGDRSVSVVFIQNDVRVSLFANGKTGVVVVAEGQLVAVELSVATGSWTEEMADWWVVARALSRWHTFLPSPDRWIEGIACTYQGPLLDIESREILNTLGLPPGVYEFHAGVDLVPNRMIDFGQLHVDAVQVLILP
jgi:hypothetical protein